MVIFDANMILRYLLNDNVEMADQAEKYLRRNGYRHDSGAGEE